MDGYIRIYELDKEKITLKKMKTGIKKRNKDKRKCSPKMWRDRSPLGEKGVRHVSQESPITSKAQRHDTIVPIPTKSQAPAGVFDNK